MLFLCFPTLLYQEISEGNVIEVECPWRAEWLCDCIEIALLKVLQNIMNMQEVGFAVSHAITTANWIGNLH